MNILPKKKWHVRTKENMARVRRDEAAAAEAEQSRLERVRLAEHERRLELLKAKQSDPFKSGRDKEEGEDTKEIQPSSSGHINFFEELEQQERSNMASGNKEYQAEKKAEQHAWESKMGIMKKFAEDTMEISGEKNWWEKIERIKPEVKEKNVTEKKMNKKEKKHKKRKRRRSSSEEEEDSAEAKKKRIEALRAERLQREAEEKRREAKLIKR
ncbi:unnamed protein product [Bursaphelenchus xylophilus]|uniref:(pine wood nematode) hypothetical protein n=1 Tax=Bursaphelenchus xylophilus TaxID=6326 RepID=A0A1I7S907_BURXY|nr:unnamed protein product [Bursaphelenchus xylophilus]CAG9086104.1 unnamed protein product [Bursaphelenchus xylophilus]